MANKEQLEILKQGVEVWNQWRKEHPDEEIDLSNTDLQGADLQGAYLQGADLERANLERANLENAGLRDAFLQFANLERANLENAGLRDAVLRIAHLQGANLERAVLEGADLQRVYLQGANLRGANLQYADLQYAGLRGATLEGADLQRAKLEGAVLEGANLQNADLQFTNLVNTKLTHANITGAYLYGTARDDWVIDGIKCKYVFWEYKFFILLEKDTWRIRTRPEEQWKLEHRTPKDRDFRPGEFEALYKQLPTFEYIFEHGFTAIDAVVMSRVVDMIGQQNPEFELKLDSFHSRGQPHAKFTVREKSSVDDALRKVTDGYEARIKALEGNQEYMMKMFVSLMEQSRLALPAGAQEPNTPERQELKRLQEKLNKTLADSPEEQAILEDIRTLQQKTALTRSITALIQSLPNLHNDKEQRAFLIQAGLDQQLQDQISVSEPPAQFVPLLVSTSRKYGTLADGRHALEAVLEAAKNYIGQEKKVRCDELIQEVQVYFTEENT